MMNELPGTPVGPGVKTRLPPAYVATKLFVSVFNLSVIQHQYDLQRLQQLN